MSLSSKKRIIMTFFCIVTLTIFAFTSSKYSSRVSNTISLNITEQSSYTVVFHSNNGNDTTITQTFNIGEQKALTANSFTNGNLTFSYWNTAANGSGTNYKDMQSVVNIGSANGVVDLYAQWINGIAEMNGTYYSTLKYE